MSLIPGIAGQKTQLIDGVQTDSISELTSTKGVQIQGKTDGSDPSPGYIGQIVTYTLSYADRITITNNTPSNVVSGNIPAGTWMLVGGIAGIIRGTTLNECFWSVSTTSATFDNNMRMDMYNGTGIGNGVRTPIPVGSLYKFTTTTTVYLVCQSRCADSGNPQVWGQFTFIRIA